jgi:hypothetical protein
VKEGMKAEEGKLRKERKWREEGERGRKKGRKEGKEEER